MSLHVWGKGVCEDNGYKGTNKQRAMACMHVCMYVRVYVCKYACRHVFAGSVLATLTDIVGSPEMHAGVVGRFGPVQHPVMHDGDVVLRVCRGGRGGGWWWWWWGWW